MRRARPEWSAWLARAGSWRSRRSTRARSCGGCARTARCAARSAPLRRTSCTRARWRSRTSTGRGCWPSPSWPRPPPALEACVERAVHGRRRAARRRARSRLQALDRQPARRVGRSRRSSFPAPGTPTRCSTLEPAAVLIGNGPGDPAQLDGPVETVRDLLGRVPLFGICLGHQLVGLALGLNTFKLPFGHRGANHPVRVTGSSRVLVTAQNHGFAVEPGDAAEVSHVSLNDGTVEGLARRRLRDAPVPPRGRARARTTPFPSSTGSPRRAEENRPSQHPDRRLRPDSHRAGLRVRLRRRPGLPGAARRGLPGRARRTRTRPRS